jgi:hypothetical protein
VLGVVVLGVLVGVGVASTAVDRVCAVLANAAAGLTPAPMAAASAPPAASPPASTSARAYRRNMCHSFLFSQCVWGTVYLISSFEPGAQSITREGFMRGGA